MSGDTSARQATRASLALREIASVDPDRIAVEIDERRVRYRDLNEQADRLAQRLAAALEPGERVALRAGGTHEMAVGFMGIRRAGLICVPVDPAAPADRLRVILDDVEPGVLLTDIDEDADLGLAIPVADPTRYGSELEAVPIDRAGTEVISILYTSGSTGTPKGIMLTSGQFDSQLSWSLSVGPPGISRRGLLAVGTVGFIELMFAFSLVSGGTLVSYEMRRHGLAGLASWIERTRIGLFLTVPTVLRHLLASLAPDQHFPDLVTVRLTGEPPTGEDVMRLRRHLPERATIMNIFGLTEASTITSLEIPHEMPLEPGPLPPGIVPDGVEVSIVGPDGEEVPLGEPGEIVIRSRGIAKGYWRRPDLTREVIRELGADIREFRTGDAGRLVAGRRLEHLGRVDQVVKISGNRVELGEVEHALGRIDGIASSAAATYQDDAGNTRLVACVVPDPDTRIDPRLVRAALARRLPGYMVPTRIAVASSLPQLANGKLDRMAIAALPATAVPTRADAMSGSEAALAGIWREILELKSVGLDDDFFELGGDSLAAAALFAEIAGRLGIDRPMSLLAEAPTVSSLARMLDDETTDWDALLAVRTEGTRPPLFVVHDGIGSVLYARGLAEALGPEQPIYGIRCRGLDGAPPAESTLEELAATYVKRVQSLYPSGPYLLYGASLGGVISLEMSRQMLELGEEVPLVVLGDSYTPGPHLRPRSTGELLHHLRAIRDLKPSAQVRYARSVIAHKLDYLVSEEGRTMRHEDRELDRCIAAGEPVPPSLRGRFVARAYGKLLDGHGVQSPFPERTLLLHTRWPGEGSDHGWGSLMGSSLRVVGVPGSHNDLGREASGAYVGPLIRREVDRLFPSEQPAPSLSMA